MHPRVEEEVEIREMEGGLDPQRDFEQRRPKLDIPPQTQLEGIHFEATFSEPMCRPPFGAPFFSFIFCNSLASWRAL